MSKFYKVKTADIKRLTPDSVMVCFDIGEGLKDLFKFTAGQHVIVRKQFGTEEVRRTYSFCSSPDSGRFCIAVRKINNGRFSAFINNDLQIGDELEISAPLGEFALKTNPENRNNYVAFAAGSGITPIISMIKQVLAAEPDSRFFLYYGNRDMKHTIFADEIAALKNKYMDNFTYQFFFTRQAVDTEFLNGRINAEKLGVLYEQVFAPLAKTGGVAGYYLCGPLAMVENIKSALISAGEPEAKIHSELFFASFKDKQPKKTRTNEGIASTISIIIDGRKIDIDYRSEDGSILEAALKSGIDVSFSCKGGVCATCRGKVLAGEVDMALNYGLEEDEIADGFVLSCQSVPLSKNVTISYDE